jgi:hypothetical protein
VVVEDEDLGRAAVEETRAAATTSLVSFSRPPRQYARYIGENSVLADGESEPAQGPEQLEQTIASHPLRTRKDDLTHETLRVPRRHRNLSRTDPVRPRRNRPLADRGWCGDRPFSWVAFKVTVGPPLAEGDSDLHRAVAWKPADEKSST